MVHKRIRQLRIEGKLTQEHMAAVLNISQNAYCLTENGTTRLIDYESIKLIAAKLEVKPRELGLFGGLEIGQHT